MLLVNNLNGFGARRRGGDPYFASVQLLLHFDGADASTTFTDSSSFARTVGVGGNAQIDTSQSMFGGSSGQFDGTGDYIFIDGETALAFGTGDFTIEFFVRLNATGAVYGLYDARPNATGNNPILYFDADNTVKFFAFAAVRITSAATLSANTWYHIAVSRVSGTTRLFIDGAQSGSSYTDSNNYGNDAGNRPIIGADSLGNVSLNGRLDEYRVTVGVGRYSANFTAPTTAFPDS